jgi:iron complex outermembrane receptor protein
MKQPNSTSFKKKLLGISALTLSTLIVAPAAVAQDDSADAASEETKTLNSIVVTAQKRSESIQDIPFSIAATPGETLEKLGATESADFLKKIPGVAFQDTGPGVNQLVIRGASANPIRQDAANAKEGVGVYLDEIPMSLALFNPDLDPYDLERVEVLRGPQGTLFGSGSLSGTVRYIARKPDADGFAGNFSAGVSTVSEGGNGYDLKGMLNIPLSNSSAIRAVAYHNEYGGFIDRVSATAADGSQIGLVEKDANSGSKTGGRLAFRLERDRTRMDLSAVYQKSEFGGSSSDDFFYSDVRGFGPFVALPAPQIETTNVTPVPGELEQIREFDETFDNEILAINGTLTFKFDNFDLVSSTSYLEREIENVLDITNPYGSFFPDAMGNPVVIPTAFNDKTDAAAFSQEVRLVSSGDGRLDWIIGAFYQDTERNYLQTAPSQNFDAITGINSLDFNSSNPNSLFDFAIDVKLEQVALFGEATYQLTDSLSATVGLRAFEFDETSSQLFTGVLNNGVIDSGSSSANDGGVNPRLILEYEASENITLSAQASRGFRLGGANSPLPGFCTGDLTALGLGSEPGPFESETLWNYEVGAKTVLANNRVVLNASAYQPDLSPDWSRI